MGGGAGGAGAGRALLAAEEAELSAFSVEHVLGGQEEPEARDVTIAGFDEAAAAAAAAAAAGGGRHNSRRRDGPAGGADGKRQRAPRAAVVVVSKRLDARAAARAMSAAPGVAAVTEDRWVSVASPEALALATAAAAAPACVAPSFLAGTVATPTPEMDWPGCYVPGITKVAWFGERCGAYLDAARWTGMYAFFASNSSLVPGCVKARARRDADGANALHFGDCGAAPGVAPQLPTQLCAEASSSSSDGATAKEGQQQQQQQQQQQPNGQQPTGQQQPACIPADATDEFRARLDSPVRCGGVATSEAVFRGVRCGPGLRWVRWSSITLPEGARGCRFSRSSTDLRWNAQWLGQCGVPPQYNTAMPTRVCADAGGGVERKEAGEVALEGDAASGDDASADGRAAAPTPAPAPIPSPVAATPAPSAPEVAPAAEPARSSPSPAPLPLQQPSSPPASDAHRYTLPKGE